MWRRSCVLLQLPNLESLTQHPSPLLILEDGGQDVAVPASSERSRISTLASSSFWDTRPSLTQVYLSTCGHTAPPTTGLSVCSLSLTHPGIDPPKIPQSSRLLSKPLMLLTLLHLDVTFSTVSDDWQSALGSANCAPNSRALNSQNPQGMLGIRNWCGLLLTDEKSEAWRGHPQSHNTRKSQN